ncbi:MAG: hypothetical protein ABI658_02995 [Acidimicrobiales bacterium]
MKKFMAIGHHGPVDPSEGTRAAKAALTWIPEQLANGFLDCLYSMKGGGRMIVANAESDEELRAKLNASPDVAREWHITELIDGLTVIRDYLGSSS